MKNWHPCQPLCVILVNDLTSNINILIRHNNPTLHPHLVGGGWVCSSQFRPCTYTRFYFVLHHVFRLLTFKYSVSHINPPPPPTPLIIRAPQYLCLISGGIKLYICHLKLHLLREMALAWKLFDVLCMCECIFQSKAVYDLSMYTQYVILELPELFKVCILICRD